MRSFLQQFNGCLELLRQLPPAPAAADQQQPQPQQDVEMADAAGAAAAAAPAAAGLPPLKTPRLHLHFKSPAGW